MINNGDSTVDNPHDDITGQSFGSLTALRQEEPDNWVCRCICGREVVEHKVELLHGTAPSCGYRRACRSVARREQAKLSRFRMSVREIFDSGVTAARIHQIVRERGKEPEKRVEQETDLLTVTLNDIVNNIGSPAHATSLPGPGITMREAMDQLDLPSARRTPSEELRIARNLRRMGFSRWKVPRETAAGPKLVVGYLRGKDIDDVKRWGAL